MILCSLFIQRVLSNATPVAQIFLVNSMFFFFAKAQIIYIKLIISYCSDKMTLFCSWFKWLPVFHSVSWSWTRVRARSPSYPENITQTQEAVESVSYHTLLLSTVDDTMGVHEPYNTWPQWSGNSCYIIILSGYKPRSKMLYYGRRVCVIFHSTTQNRNIVRKHQFFESKINK